jgi:hypothetical protein
MPTRLKYRQAQGLPRAPLETLANHPRRLFEATHAWQAHWAYLGITDARHVRIATEGA